MTTITLAKPATAERFVVPVDAGAVFKLSFDTGAASFERSGSDLLFSFEDGGELCLEGFFSLQEGGALPSFVLDGGQVVDGGALLADVAPGMDLSLAAGTVLSSGSGLGDYAATGGDLIAGVERFGSLGAQPFESASTLSARAEVATVAAPGRAFPGDGGEGGNPGAGGPGDESGEKPVVNPVEYTARVVLYATADGAEGASLQFRPLGADGRPLAGLAADSIRVTSLNGLVDVAGANIEFDPATGLFSIKLTAEGLQALTDALNAAGGERGGAANVYDYLTIEVGGRSYSMQVVLNQSGEFSAAAENALNAPGKGGVIAEWHTESGGTGQGDRSAGNSVDEIFFNNAVNGFGDGVLNTGGGADSVYITGGVTGVNASESADVIAREGLVHITGSNAEGRAYGVYAEPDGVATVTAKDAHIVASGGSYASGVYAASDYQQATGEGGGGKNVLTAEGGLTVHAEAPGVTTTAVYAAAKAENVLTGGNITITSGSEEALSGAAYGLSTVGGKNILTTGENGRIEVSTTASGSSYALRAAGGEGQSGENLLTGAASAEINATLTLDNSWAIGMYAASGGNNRIEGVDSVTVTSRAAATAAGGVVSALYAGGGVNSITGGSLVELAGVNDSSGGVYTMYANTGKNIIEGENVTVTARSQGPTAYALYAVGGENIITVSDSLSVEAYADSSTIGYVSAMGLGASGGGANIVRGTDKALHIEISAASGAEDPRSSTHAVRASGDGSRNVIEGGKYAAGTVDGDTITLNGDLYTIVGGKNLITVGDANDSITITGGVSGSNTISLGAGDDTLTTGYVSGGYSDKADLIFGDGHKTVSLGGIGGNVTLQGSEGSTFDLTVGTVSPGAFGKTSTIDTGGLNLNDTITFSKDVAPSPSGVFYLYTRGGDDVISVAGNMEATTGVTTLIATGGNETRDDLVHISVDGKILNSYGGWNIISTGNDAKNYGSGAGNDTLVIDADFESRSSSRGNQAHTGAGNDRLEINGDILATGGSNAFYTHDGNDTVVINGNIASAGSGKNIINLGDGDNEVTINGSLTVKAGGANTILGGKDGDTIMLNGAVGKSGLVITAGAGDDKLVLMASSAEEFSARYADWFTTMTDAQIRAMSIETLALQIGDANNSGLLSVNDIAWLWDRLAGYNEGNPTAALNLNYTFSNADGVESAWLGFIPGEIATGSGNDTIILNGKVTGQLTIDAGGGEDRLVLQAGNAAVFTANYKAWLTAQGADGLVNMGVESLTAELRDGGNISDLQWLQEIAEQNGIVLVVASGDGDDVFILNQNMTEASFTMNAGDGHDVLVLKAGGVEEFMNRYAGWLQGRDAEGFGPLVGAGFEAVKLDVPGLDAATLAFVKACLAGQGLGDMFVSGYAALSSLAANAVFDGQADTSYDVALRSMSGNAVTLRDGHDLVHVTGNMQASTLDTGDGDDMVTIGQSMLANTDAAAKTVTASELRTGAGNDTVTIGGDVKSGALEYADSEGVYHYVVARHGIDTGDGDDALTIKGEARLVDINMGEGDNLLDIGKALSGERYYDKNNNNESVREYSRVAMGDGNDTLHIGANVLYAAIAMGDGDNRVDIESDAWYMDLTAGDGNDSVTIGGSLEYYSKVDLGEGDNSFLVEGSMDKSDVSAGAGDDSLTIARNVSGGIISTGAGDDAVHIGGDAVHGWEVDSQTAIPLTIATGEGDDTLTIGGGLSGRLGSYDYNPDVEDYGTVVSMGEGNDVMSVGGKVSAAVIAMGAGDDALTIGGNVTASVINMGEGNDTLTIDGALLDEWVYPPGASGDFHYIGNSIDMGAGNDLAVINGGSFFSYDGATAGADHQLSLNAIAMGEGDDTLVINGALSNSILDGGDGNDVLHLGIASGDAVNTIFGEAANNTVTGFETLVLDMDNAGNETLSLTSLLGKADGFEDIYIRGNAGDAVELKASDGWSKVDGGTHTTADGIVYDTYQHSGDDGDAILVYVQQAITAITG